jgi:hypothetical protein
LAQAKSYFSLTESISILSIDINATKASAVVLKDLAQAKSYFSLIESIFILSIDINATKASAVVLKDLAQAKSYFIYFLDSPPKTLFTTGLNYTSVSGNTHHP